MLSDWLDEERSHTVVANEIFQELPRKFEDKFHDDMQALNVGGGG